MKMKNVEDIYPLSPMQQGMLFHTIYAPNEGVYTEQLTCTLEGEPNVPAFKQSVHQALERHPALRSYFLWEGLDEPLQVVREQARLPWSEHDWRELSESERLERLAAFLKADREQGFELSKAPLMRAAMIRLTTLTYKFIFTYHHILLDGWSAGLLFKEVFSTYHAACEGQRLELEPTRPYSDYIGWLQRQEMSRVEMFWREELKGFTSPTALPLDAATTGNRAHRQAQEYAEEQVELSLAETEALQSFARTHRLTLSSLLKGAWAILLSRYSGEQDVVFGTTVSGRPTDLDGADSMIGLFINTLPVRVKVSRELPLLSFLRNLHEQQFKLQPYEHSSLVQVHGWSEVPGNLPLFQSIFVFENHPLDNSLLDPDAAKQALRVVDVESQGRIDYPLTVLAAPGAELSLWVSYDTGRSNSQTIKLMLGHLRSLLEGIVANPQQRIADLPMLTGGERELILHHWNQPPRQLPPIAPTACASTLVSLFEAQVTRSPAAIALRYEERQLSFAQLNERANQLAHLLIERGVGPEQVVALCLDRSPEMVIAMLAILKAGAAYLPLDPQYPQARLQFMLADSQARLVLTTSQWVTQLGLSPESQVESQDTERQSASALRQICLDTEQALVCAQPVRNPQQPVSAGNLAYLIYTSGSTGLPKAVCISHHNVVRLFTSTEQLFHFTARDVWSMFHSYAFDFSVWEMWGALLYGGQLVIVPYWVSRSPEAFYQLVAEAGVTVLNQTPSAFVQFSRVDEQARAGLGLRVVVFGGEALELSSLRGWVRRHGVEEPELVNMYGITETTVHVTYRKLRREEVEGSQRAGVGRAIGDLRVYVMDGEGQLCGVGVRGEICVGGEGLARGYEGRAGLTAQRYVPDGVSGGRGERLYRTGDEGRYMEGGEIEYLGRVDEQVKVRGFRIEVGEIQAKLNEHAGVRESVVIAQEDSEGEKRLIAYVVSPAGVELKTSDLRSQLQAKLPDYMIPAHFVMLDALPLTPSGKVDRRSLPAPDGERPELDKPFIAPRTPVEEEVAQIWRELLSVRQVGVYDNFFELGGHSLLLTQLSSRISEAFNIKLPLRTLFDAPTIEEMTIAIAEALIGLEAEQDSAELLRELQYLSLDEAAALLEVEA